MSIASPQRTDTKPWYKHFWPWLIIFFPLTAVVAGISTVIIAVVTDDGLVEEEYYKQGLLINFSKEMDKRASELGLSGYMRVDTSNGKIYVLVEEANKEADLSSMTITLKHATQADMDQTISLEALNDKEFTGALKGLAAGKWNVSVAADDQWRLTGKFKYPDRIDTKLKPNTL